jgi:phosphoribosyl 1,2-cyclic phosphodiesterase
VSVNFTILGSGSAGNCAYLETAEARILVDAGFSPRQIRQRLATLGRTPENLTAILITHEHSDHIAGLVGIAAKLNIPIYCNRPTKDAFEFNLKTKFNNCNLFNTGASFEIADVQVDTFAIPHDAQDPVGFLIRTAAGNIGFATDLGHVTKLVLERIRAANVLVLESNHDVKMLQDCPRRSWALKQRILGRHGHISNLTAAETVAQIVSADLRQLYLAHLSRECNKPELAEHIMAEQLHHIGATHVRMQIAAQDVPCETLTL